MNCLHAECRQAYRNVFGAAFGGRGILNPFAAVGNDCLAGYDVEFASLVFHAQSTVQHDSKFVKLWRLSGLFPSLRATHVGDADACRFGVNSADELVNQFGFSSRGADARGLSD